MDVALAALVFTPALALGSFLNVVAARLPEHRSIVHPRSACPGCDTPISWRDNIPLLSWLLLRGRCRSCREPISARYPLVELSTAVLVAACFAAFGPTRAGLVGAILCAALVVLSAIDAERKILPDLIVLPTFVLVLVLQLALAPERWLEWIAASFGASLFLFLALLAYPAGMGMGDVKLALLLGAALGKLVVVGMFIGMLAALVPAIVLLARHGVSARKAAIPFGPFLAFGAIVALFVGERIMDAYLSRF